MDKKSQIQALVRTQPLLPMQPGQVERRNHVDTRHGMTSLFAALDVATSAVLGCCYLKHRSSEFCKFLDPIEANVPANFDIHLVMDNYATHKTKPIRDRLAILAAIQRFCHRTLQVGEIMDSGHQAPIHIRPMLFQGR